MFTIDPRLIRCTGINSKVGDWLTEINSPICFCDKPRDEFITQIQTWHDLDLVFPVVTLLHLFDKVKTRRPFFILSGVRVPDTCVRVCNESVKHRIIDVISCFRRQKISFRVTDGSTQTKTEFLCCILIKIEAKGVTVKVRLLNYAFLRPVISAYKKVRAVRSSGGADLMHLRPSGSEKNIRPVGINARKFRDLLFLFCRR